MSWMLNLAYAALSAAAAPWLLWNAWRRGKYRRGWCEKLFGLVPLRDGDEPCVWLHAVSVGEVNLVAPLIAEIRRRRPGWRIVVTSTTDAGLELARTKYPDVSASYAPLDFSWAVRRALRRIRPSLMALVELELWPNLIAAADREGVPVAVVNGRLSERSFRGYRRLRPLVRRMLARVAVAAVQNDEYRGRFVELGLAPERAVVTGSLKFDGAVFERDNPRTARLAERSGLGPEDVVFVAGSTQVGEERIALETFRRLAGEFPRLRLILVPRHPDRFDEAASLCRRAGFPFLRRTALDEAPRDAAPPWRVLLVDTVGELGAWWGTAHVAFVGGSFGDRGGQNMIEPAAYGAAVCFGPNTRNFRDVVGMLSAADAAETVADPEALVEFVRRCLRDSRRAATLGANARRLVRSHQGAAAKTFALLEPLVERSIGAADDPSLKAA